MPRYNWNIVEIGTKHHKCSVDIISYVVFFCVQWVQVTGDCSFCLYWWNCWPPLSLLGHFVIYLLPTALAVLRFTASDYLFDIFKFVFHNMYFCRLIYRYCIVLFVHNVNSTSVSEWLLFNANWWSWWWCTRPRRLVGFL
jgi:hypothetical protein